MSVIMIKCEQCGKEVEKKYTDKYMPRFCSKECGNTSRQNRKEYKCFYCGKSFIRRLGRHPDNKRHFCSSECFYASGGKGKTGKHFICANCGVRFYRSPADVKPATKCCSVVCAGQFKRDKTRDVRLSIRSSGKYRSWILKVFERDAYHCQDCGKRGGRLDAHHNLIPFQQIWKGMMKEFTGGDLYEYAINYPLLWDLDNGLTVCRDCHILRHFPMRVEHKRNAPVKYKQDRMNLCADTRSDSGGCIPQPN